MSGDTSRRSSTGSLPVSLMLPKTRLFSFPSAVMAMLTIVASACDSDPGYAGRSSAQWIAELKSGDESGKAGAARALGKVLESRPDYPKVVTALVAALRDTSDVVRIAAASALTAEGVDTQAAIDGLHEVLHDSIHADVRTSAVLIISSLGPERAIALISYLCELLNDPSPRVRAAAVDAIGAIGLPASREIPSISQMRTDSVPEVRQAVLGALVNLGADANALIPVARSALGDTSAIVRASAADALRFLGPASLPVVADLTRALGDPDERVVRSAMLALGTIGPGARSALPSLRRLRLAARNGAELQDETIAILEGRRPLGRMGGEPTSQEKCRNNPTRIEC